MEIRALVRRLHCSSPDGASSLVGLLPNDESRGFSHHRCTLVPVNLSLAVDGQATPSTFETTNQLGVAPFHLYDARIHDNSSLNPDLIRSSSLSSPLSVLSSSPACPLLNRGSAHLHQPYLSPSGFDGNPAYLSEPVSPPASAIYLSVDVIGTTSDLQPRSMTSRNFLAYAFASELRSIPKCAWPNSFAEAYIQIIKILKARLSVQDVRYLAAGLNSLDNLKISHGFIGVYNLRLLQYHFFRKNLSSSFSNEESISPPYLPSMNGDVLLDYFGSSRWWGLFLNVTCDYFSAVRLCRECSPDAFKRCLESAVIFI
ncbi:hypothetical protein HID58_040702 [Brassica napus]|uniref:Uncharacterized protein n=1 Tax=Brassica napus TaxID=3708 RepID=A0ABQ8B8S8_BRANA|nr:hypothetical protein HID58_040702 [Brassica napus]